LEVGASFQLQGYKSYKGAGRMVKDLRFAFRQLRKSPGFTLLALIMID